jgi:hypothetical protein
LSTLEEPLVATVAVDESTTGGALWAAAQMAPATRTKAMNMTAFPALPLIFLLVSISSLLNAASCRVLLISVPVFIVTRFTALLRAQVRRERLAPRLG